MGAPKAKQVGLVTLVAAGPGEIDLMPARALRALQSAELVIADADAVTLAERCSDAEIVPAIDAAGLPLARAARAKAVAAAARSGKRVVRLFAGEPVFDGSFSREAEALRKAGVTFEVVPGVSAVTAAAAYAGVALTDSTSLEVRVIDATNTPSDWSEHADEHVTLVFLNGAATAAQIAKQLIAVGRDPQTPALIVSGATTRQQRSLATTLESLPVTLKSAKSVDTGVLIVGSAAARTAPLSWFESKPLFGWRVLLPLTKGALEDLVVGLEALGASVTQVPTISVEPPRTPQQMDKAVHGVVGGRYEWLVFTSANAVRAVWDKIVEYGLDARAFAGLRLAASGSGTAAALQEFGLKPDVSVAEGESSSDLLEVFPEYDELIYPFNRVLVPRADIATESLHEGLVALGWEVEEVTAYRTVRAAPPAVEVRDAIKSGDFDAVVFASAATVRNLVGLAGKPHAKTLVFCAGPKTAKAAEEHGLVPKFIAAEPTIASMLETTAAAGDDLREAALEAGEYDWRPSQRRHPQRRKAN